MPDFVTTILAKALVMLVEALVTRLVVQMMRTSAYRRLPQPAAA
jgi:hypothetical protein